MPEITREMIDSANATLVILGIMGMYLGIAAFILNLGKIIDDTSGTAGIILVFLGTVIFLALVSFPFKLFAIPPWALLALILFLRRNSSQDSS